MILRHSDVGPGSTLGTGRAGDLRRRRASAICCSCRAGRPSTRRRSRSSTAASTCRRSSSSPTSMPCSRPRVVAIARCCASSASSPTPATSPRGTGSGARTSRRRGPARTTVVAGFAVPGHPDRAAGDRRDSIGAPDEQRPRRRGRRRRRRALLRLLPAAQAVRRDRRREQPHRQRRLVRQRRLALPRAGRPAARAGTDALRDALAVRPRLGAVLQAGRLEPACALAPAVLDVLQRERPCTRDGRDRAARLRRVRA